jgi:hypothetical protein
MTNLQRQHSTGRLSKRVKVVLFLMAETQVVDPICSSLALLLNAHMQNWNVIMCWAQKHWLASPRRLYSIVVFSFDTTGKVSALPSTTKVAAGSMHDAKALTKDMLVRGLLVPVRRLVETTSSHPAVQ